MGSYTYNMEVKDIDGKGYDAYKIVEYMLYRLVVFDEFYPFQDQLEDFIEKYYSEMGKFCILSFDNTERTKWYTDDKEMLKLSKKFPDVLFKLHGEGEESDDIWERYFMNGKSQYCQAEIVIPPFDKSKLS